MHPLLPVLDKPAVSQAERAPLLSEALRTARADFVAKNPRSLAQHLKAAEVLPGGTTRSTLFTQPFPVTLAGAEGATVTSLDGHVYTDFIGEYTAGLYGHSNAILRQAAIAALDHGWAVGGQIQAEEELARLLCERFASIEQIRFSNSGTEANLYAIIAARAVTGRSKVVVFEGAYHGGVFMFAPGPRSALLAPFDFVVAPYNDVDGTLALLNASGDDVAAVLVEPMQGSGGCISAEEGFLEALRDWTARSGSWLIFDEVMTSRLSPGGLQAVSGVTPDMTTLGKYLGGGFSFGAFGGRAELMRHFDPTTPDAFFHAGTFNNNVFTMSAGVAGLRDVYTREVAVALNARGSALRERLNYVAHGARFPMQFTGVGSMMCVHMCSGRVRSVRDLADKDTVLHELFYLEMLKQGIWIASRGMVSLSLPISDADCDSLVEAVDAFVRTLNDSVYR